MEDDEKIALREQVMDELIQQQGPLGIKQLEEYQELGEKLKPYRCVGCYKIVYSNEDYVLRNGRRTHRKCNEKIESDARKARERLEEQKKLAEKHRHDVEHNLKPISRNVIITVKGLKKDIEKFDSDLDKIAKEYNLDPWCKMPLKT